MPNTQFKKKKRQSILISSPFLSCHTFFPSLTFFSFTHNFPLLLPYFFSILSLSCLLDKISFPTLALFAPTVFCYPGCGPVSRQTQLRERLRATTRPEPGIEPLAVRIKQDLGMVIYTCNPSSQEVGVGGTCMLEASLHCTTLHSRILFRETKTKTKQTNKQPRKIRWEKPKLSSFCQLPQFNLIAIATKANVCFLVYIVQRQNGLSLCFLYPFCSMYELQKLKYFGIKFQEFLSQYSHFLLFSSLEDRLDQITKRSNLKL